MKSFNVLMYVFLSSAVIAMALLCDVWAEAYENLRDENDALNQVIQYQATEGDMLVREIGRLAEGLCIEHP